MLIYRTSLKYLVTTLRYRKVIVGLTSLSWMVLTSSLSMSQH